MLSIGIVGLPNVGKSTLFNALTRKQVEVANYPFCTIDPSVGVVAVPDERLEKLAEFSKSEKVIPAAIEFVDIAGLVKGAAEGAGLGNQFLAHIREVDAIAHVVRVFDDENIVHVSGAVDPLRDIEVVNVELALADLATVEKRLSSVEKEARRGESGAAAERELLQKLKDYLEGEGQIRDMVLNTEEKAIVKNLHLLTAKHVIYVLNRKNGGENYISHQNEKLNFLQNEETIPLRVKALTDFFVKNNAKWVAVDAGLEQELKDLAPGEKPDFRKEIGVLDDGVGDLIRASYELLGLITFFTTGPKETRAWTIRRGASVREAGAAIHTDFRDKFIRADVIDWVTFLKAGSHAAAREKGLIRTEGKEYIVSDGDVVEFRIGQGNP